MSADAMVSALTYRADGPGHGGFDLAAEIDRIEMSLEEQGFDTDRTTILRAALANIDEDIYRTNWTNFSADAKSSRVLSLKNSMGRTAASLDKAVNFLVEIGVPTSRVLPYSMQLALLSAFFDSAPEPTSRQREFLRQWFWVSSFSGWFGGANPARVNNLVTEFRNKLAHSLKPRPGIFSYFVMSEPSQPLPRSFDTRGARTRSLLLVMLSLEPMSGDGKVIVDPWKDIARIGPEAVGYIVPTLPKEFTGSPANRMIRPPEAPRGALRKWVLDRRDLSQWDVLASHGVDAEAADALAAGDVEQFVRRRQATLIGLERAFQERVGVQPSIVDIGAAVIDTE
jgi:hypothetical protein